MIPGLATHVRLGAEVAARMASRVVVVNREAGGGGGGQTDDQPGFAGAAECYLAVGRAEAEHHGGKRPAAAAAPNPASHAAAATHAAITYMSPPDSSYRVTPRKRLLVQTAKSR